MTSAYTRAILYPSGPKRVDTSVVDAVSRRVGVSTRAERAENVARSATVAVLKSDSICACLFLSLFAG